MHSGNERDIFTTSAKAKESDIRDKVKIMTGSAPVTQAYCESIGADYYTPDAATASEVALQICFA